MSTVEKLSWNDLVSAVAEGTAGLADLSQRVATYDGLDLVPDQKVAVAGQLRDTIAKLGQVASVIALLPDGLRAFQAFDAKYAAHPWPKILGGAAVVAPAAMAELRAAARDALHAKPRSPEELGRKVRVGITLGIHAKVKPRSRAPDPYVANLYDHWWPQVEVLPPWFLAVAVGYEPSISEWEFGRREGNFVGDRTLVRELLSFAGSSWQAVIDADVARLNAREDGASE